MDSELVGLACEADFLCPSFEPRCLTVATDEEVELERESLRLTAGGRPEWLIFEAGETRSSLNYDSSDVRSDGGMSLTSSPGWGMICS